MAFNTIKPNTIGNIMSKEKSKITLLFSKCSGLPSWKSDLEIATVLSGTSVALTITDYFFDIDDYYSPVKVNFRGDIVLNPMNDILKQTVIKVRDNKVIDHPSPYLFSNSHEYEFYYIPNKIKYPELKSDRSW